MRKLLLLISTLALTLGLIGFLFNLKEYDFMAQLEKISMLEFTNPISELQNVISQAKQLYSFTGQDIAWYEYIPLFFKWVGLFATFPIILIKDVALNLYYGLQAILYFIGF